jgi:hypothetical protein
MRQFGLLRPCQAVPQLVGREKAQAGPSASATARQPPNCPRQVPCTLLPRSPAGDPARGKVTCTWGRTASSPSDVGLDRFILILIAYFASRPKISASCFVSPPATILTASNKERQHRRKHGRPQPNGQSASVRSAGALLRPFSAILLSTAESRQGGPEFSPSWFRHHLDLALNSVAKLPARDQSRPDNFTSLSRAFTCLNIGRLSDY